ncbi:MAG: prephenate dehydratase [Oscillospiraceae bacterium]|nr:prephenate dehydratase [Oscillospiraceae bacterium]
MKNLDQLRGKIDQIDDELLSLFAARMDTVADIAAYKREQGLTVLDKKRENVKRGALPEKVAPELVPSAQILYDTLFDISRAHQSATRVEHSPLYKEIQSAIESTPNLFPQSATVACQGVEGAYSQMAAERLFKRPEIQYLKTFESVFTAIENGFCDYGLLPIENSTAGSVTKIYDLMKHRDFKIVRSVRLKVDHNLVVRKGVKREDIREIFSHEQAISQCAAFLEQFGQDVKITRCENTAAAAETVANSGRSDIAAICSHSCIALYDLDCLARDIQDRSNNYTRFICISKKLEIYPGADRTSIMMVLSHKPGSLYKALARFYALGINLNKLESRPVPDRDFDFMFYFDLETSIYADEFAKLLDSLQEICEECQYLGSYIEVL